METLIAPTFNFLVLVGLFVYFLREPAKSMISTRHTSMRDELERVRGQLSQAQNRYSEFSARLSAMDAEIATIREQTRKDAEDAKVRIIRDTHALAETIVADAKTSAESAMADLRRSLRAEFADTALSRADELIRQRLTAEDKARIRRDFSQQLGSMPRQMETVR